MFKNGVVRVIRLNSPNSKANCVGCIFGKGHLAAIPKARTRNTKAILELIHSDVIGPIEVESVCGSRYVIPFIDDKSNWTVQYTMHRKSESLTALRSTRRTLSEIRIERLRSDNGGEYLSNDFKFYLEVHAKLRITYGMLVLPIYLTCAYLDHYAGMFALIKKVKKLDPRSREALLMSYSSQSKGYKIWDDELQRFIVSRDVTFDEDKPYSSSRKATPLKPIDITNDTINSINSDSQFNNDLGSNAMETELLLSNKFPSKVSEQLKCSS
eukprot:IDg6130t1